MAYNDLIGKYGWDAVTILYENNESMSRLKEVLDRTAKVQNFDCRPLNGSLLEKILRCLFTN